MEVRLATAAAPGRAANEDYALAVGNFVAVFDGVTEPEGQDTGCIHGPSWYVRRLAARFAAAYTADPTRSLPHLLADAIDGVRADHGSDCDLRQPATPASTVCALKVDVDAAAYLVLGDSTLLTDCGGQL